MNKISAISVIKDFKSHLGDYLQERLESGEILTLLEHTSTDTMDANWMEMGPQESLVVTRLRAAGRMQGSDDGAYEPGTLLLTFKNKAAVNHFADVLDDDPDVDTYEIEAVRENLVDGVIEDAEYDIDNILFDKDFEFNVIVYLNPDIVVFPVEEMEFDDTDASEIEDGYISEVRRKIKVNFRGKKRIKMQCRPGFRWEKATKTCKKIAGAEVAKMRKQMRRAVLTKRSKGQAFKTRVLRKTRKANRFRKAYGLH